MKLGEVVIRPSEAGESGLRIMHEICQLFKVARFLADDFTLGELILPDYWLVILPLVGEFGGKKLGRLIQDSGRINPARVK